MINKILFGILFSLFTVISFSQQGQVSLNGGTSSSLQKAISKLKGSGTITITGEVIIDSNITVPAGVTLKVNEGGMLNCNSSVDLNIEGILVAGLYPIFKTYVALAKSSPSEIHVEWFGTDHTAVNNALLSAGRTPVRISENIIVSNTIFIDSYQTLLINENTKIITTNLMKGKSVISNKNENDTEITIIGGIIDGALADKVPYDGIIFNNVTNSSIKNLSCTNVHITASRDTGNIRLNNCEYVTLDNCSVTGTWKMGIFILNGSCNTVIGGKFYGTHDSAIGVVNSPGATIDGLFVDNCGTSDGSNMSLNSERMLVINNTTINATGERNGNGITLGHNGAPASYSVCINNIIKDNRAKGIFIQGIETKDVIVLNNLIIDNGVNSDGTNSGGVAVYLGTEGHLISDNEIEGNRLGISLHKTSKNVIISNNQISSSTLYGIRNDGENILIESNNLFNKKNIYNGYNHKNQILKNNTLSSVE